MLQDDHWRRILSLVDKLLIEREKVVRLELLRQQQLNEDKQSDKDQQ